jgi:hypothetical protein
MSHFMIKSKNCLLTTVIKETIICGKTHDYKHGLKMPLIE